MRTYDAERGKITQALVEGGDLTIMQLKMRTGVGTRTLTDVLYQMRNEGAARQRQVGDQFPRKTVWFLPELPRDNGHTKMRAVGRRKGKNHVIVSATLPIYLYEIVRGEAVASRRTFSAQLTTMLESALA